MKITYIGHSGFLVECSKCILLFDYFKGNIPDIPKEKQLYVFASHQHRDHFNFDIFSLADQYPGTRYILSKDIKRKYNKRYMTVKKGIREEIYDGILFLPANEVYEDENIVVKTVDSTDLGVAFCVYTKEDEKNIFHSGDLNWWTWIGETEEESQEMERHYKESIHKLKNTSFDVVFLPLDPRQEERFYWGFHYFMENVDTKKAVPMHFWGDYKIIDKLLSLPVSEKYREKVLVPLRK